MNIVRNITQWSCVLIQWFYCFTYFNITQSTMLSSFQVVEQDLLIKRWFFSKICGNVERSTIVDLPAMSVYSFSILILYALSFSLIEDIFDHLYSSETLKVMMHLWNQFLKAWTSFTVQLSDKSFFQDLCQCNGLVIEIDYCESSSFACRKYRCLLFKWGICLIIPIPRKLPK